MSNDIVFDSSCLEEFLLKPKTHELYMGMINAIHKEFTSNNNIDFDVFIKITCLHSEIYVDMGNDYDLLSDGSELFTVIEGIEYYIKDN